MRTTAPDATFAIGARSTGNTPSTTFSGVERTWSDGLSDGPAADTHTAAASGTAMDRTDARIRTTS
jgi:hypothetical protein